MIQHFFIEGKYLGQSLRQINTSSCGSGIPQSLLFYCYGCGEVFGKAPVVDADGNNHEWFAYRLGCRKCPPAYQSMVPGSIFLSWDHEFTAAFSDAVLRWEVERHLDWFEKQGK
jgi:hypothetical protein